MAENVVDRLVVAIGFAVDQSGLTKTIRTAQSVGKEFATLAAGIGSIGGAMATWATGQAVFNSQLLTTATTLRVTTEELTALQYAATASGASAESMTAALGTLSGALTQAQQLGSGASLALGKLGIRSREADGSLRSAADVLPEVADRLGRIGNAARRAEIASTLLGGSYADLRPLLEQGSDGIAKATERAREMGVVLGEDTAKQSRRFTLALNDLRAIATGLSRRFSDSMIPTLTTLAEGLADVALNSRGIVQVGLDRAISAIGFALAGLETPGGKALAAFVGLSTVLGIGKAAGGVGGLLQSLGPLGTGLRAFAATIGAIAAGPLLPLALLIGGVVLVLDDLYVAAQGGNSAFLNFAKALGVGDDFQKQLSSGLKTMGNLLQITKIVAGEVGIQIQESFEKAAKWVGETVGWLEEMAPIIKPITSAIKDLAAGFRDLVTSIPGALMSFMTGAAERSEQFSSGLLAGTLGEGEKDKAAAVFGPLGGILDSARQREATGKGLEWSEIQGETDKRRDRFARETAQAAPAAAQAAVNVTINAGASAAELADKAANEVRRQVYAQASAVDGLR